MNIQFIFTFDELEQVIIDTFLSEEESISTMDNLISFAMKLLRPNERRELIKISCCVYNGDMQPPDWYMKENGKIFQEDLDNWRLANKMESTANKYY